jgi:hypothetical protein
MFNQIKYVKTIILLLAISPLTSTWALELEPKTNGKSCDDLYEDMLNSDCASSVSSFLRGARLKLGVSFHSLSMNINAKKGNDDLAKMTSDINPSPYASLELSNAFIGSTNFGYSLHASYLDSYALNQVITRSGKTATVDLSTYVTDTLSAFEPALFYVFGGQDSTPDQFLTIGLGATLGFSYVRGNSYLTDDKNNVGSLCFDAGSQVVNGDKSAVSKVKENCELISYDSFGFGTGANIFISGRWENWQADISFSNMRLSSHAYTFTPQTTSFTLSYVILL